MLHCGHDSNTIVMPNIYICGVQLVQQICKLSDVCGSDKCEIAAINRKWIRNT